MILITAILTIIRFYYFSITIFWKMIRIDEYYVYILSNAHNNVLYTGVTNDLARRCKEHKKKVIKGFTQKYNVNKLVYFERFNEIDEAIAREKQIKAYSRMKKVKLIESFNKDWRELFENDGFITPT